MFKVRELSLLNGKIVNFEARPGDVFLIKGANGVGKSLFLKSIARLLVSKSEEISLNGKNTYDWPVEEWRSKVLYLSPEITFKDEDTVEDFLQVPFKLSLYKNFVPRFDIKPHLKGLQGRMALLSSGQKQRLALLRVLSLDFDVLLLDESFGHMDVETRDEMLKLVFEFSRRGKIILIVSHFQMSSGQFDTREFSL